jgi:hypothetical protein
MPIEFLGSARPDEYTIRLAWISQMNECIGAENQRKVLCRNNLSRTQVTPDASRVYCEAVRI